MKIEGHLNIIEQEARSLRARLKNMVEVVRCKECRHWDTDWETHCGFHYCPMIDGLTDVDFFCADGERRDDGDGTEAG